MSSRPILTMGGLDFFDGIDVTGGYRTVMEADLVSIVDRIIRASANLGGPLSDVFERVRETYERGMNGTYVYPRGGIGSIRNFRVRVRVITAEINVQRPNAQENNLITSSTSVPTELTSLLTDHEELSSNSGRVSCLHCETVVGQADEKLTEILRAYETHLGPCGLPCVGSTRTPMQPWHIAIFGCCSMCESVACPACAGVGRTGDPRLYICARCDGRSTIPRWQLL